MSVHSISDPVLNLRGAVHSRYIGKHQLGLFRPPMMGTHVPGELSRVQCGFNCVSLSAIWSFPQQPTQPVAWPNGGILSYEHELHHMKAEHRRQAYTFARSWFGRRIPWCEGNVGEQSLYCRNRGNPESDCCNETRVLESKFKVHSVVPSRSPHSECSVVSHGVNYYHTA